MWDSTQTLVPGTPVVGPSWSGAAGSGWVRYGYVTPAVLGPGSYRAGVWNGASGGNQWYSLSTVWWSTNFPGGITNGILSCATQPDYYLDLSGTFAYPTTGYGDDNIWLDVEVTPVATGVVPAAVVATGGISMWR